jgi:phage terminase large subunit-like protein
VSLAAEQVDILRRIDKLPEKQRAELMARYQAKKSDERQLWYCKRGRICDGRPHEGADFKHARGDQWPPPGMDWDLWFYLSGRGAGKTMAGGHWTRTMANYTGRIALIGRRGTDVRATMVEGPAGLIRACERLGESYDWKPALKEFTFENGAKAFGYSGEEPESLRGPEHGAGWLDEPCHIALIDEVWSNYSLGLRSEGMPGGAKTLCTSSPLPTKWTKARIAERGQELESIDPETGEHDRAPKTITVQVSTSVNLHNLDEGYKRRVINPLKGTRKGKQELDAVLLEDVEGALWEATWLVRARYTRDAYDRIVVAVDPSGTNDKKSDATGIVVCARIGFGEDARYVVLADYTDRYTPEGWASKVADVYDEWQADAVVMERYGGDSATVIMRRAKSSKGRKFDGRIVEVTATRGKKLRAEPIVQLYERELVDHLEGADLAELEDEQLTWVPELSKESPNRVDALVHGITELSGKSKKPASWGQASGSLQPAKPRGPGSNYRRKNWNR